MYTLYRLQADELDESLLQSIRTLFHGQTIEIALSALADAAEDETAYLLRDPTNRQRLLDAIGRVGAGDIVAVDSEALATASWDGWMCSGDSGQAG